MLRAKERVFAPLCNLTVEDLVPAQVARRFEEMFPRAKPGAPVSPRE